jgi:chorismate dehydratase
LRIGAVTYLNARPLTYGLTRSTVDARIVFDHPSRLAECLAEGGLDVALIPSIEYFRHPGYVIVSDACIACEGPVRSVKLYGRQPLDRIRTLAMDEGSRTSVALTQILLKERFHLQPEIQHLPIGAALEDTGADAVMLIGDRGLCPPRGEFEFIWDLGEEWIRWTGLPFVFAMWIARPEVDLERLDTLLRSTRDTAVGRLEEIAREHASSVRMPPAECLTYLRDNLRFVLGTRQRQGLERFYDLAQRHGLAPAGVNLVFYTR